MLLDDDFQACVQRDPSRLALVCGRERYSYADILSMSSALAAALAERGVRRGDRVALFLDNGAPMVAGLYAALHLGAVFVPINPLTKTEKLSHLLADSGAATLLTQTSLIDVWKGAAANSPELQTVFVRGDGYGHHDARTLPWPRSSDSQQAVPRAVGLIDQDLAAILYTSGSTGESKGVMLTHLNMVSAARSVISYLGLRSDDVILCALSLTHGYGLYQVLMAFSLGAAVILEKSFTFPAAVVDAMAQQRATVLPGVPAMFARLLTMSGLERHDLRSLRMITNAAAALPEAHIGQLRAKFPQAQLYSMYGQTECKRVTFLPPEQLDLRPGSVGRGMPNQELWLIDERGNRLPDGSSGELVVRGSHVMLGYWRKPAETARRLKPGPLPNQVVLHTGDIFRSDAEGWLYFVGRQDDIIKCRGEKVSPREVENTIHGIEGVHEVAVIGIPDEEMGQAVKAFVVLADGVRMAERDVIRYCLAHLESFMAPKTVEFVESLPKTDSGKIRKLALR